MSEIEIWNLTNFSIQGWTPRPQGQGELFRSLIRPLFRSPLIFKVFLILRALCFQFHDHWAAVSCSPIAYRLGGVGFGIWWRASWAVHGWCMGGMIPHRSTPHRHHPDSPPTPKSNITNPGSMHHPCTTHAPTHARASLPVTIFQTRPHLTYRHWLALHDTAAALM